MRCCCCLECPRINVKSGKFIGIKICMAFSEVKNADISVSRSSVHSGVGIGENIPVYMRGDY
jgi:predicted NUDIX family NTP pyrophosphohydrolase